LTVGAGTWHSPITFNQGSGNIEFSGTQTLGANSLTAVSNSGNLTLDQNAKIVSTAASGNSIILAAGGNFINNDSNDGSGTLAPGSGTARYLVYSTTPVSDTFDGISPTSTHYSGTYSNYAPGSVTESGNTFIYNSTAGTITVTANNQSMTYGDSLPSLTYGFSCTNGCTQGATLATGPTLSVGGSESTSLNYIAGNHTISAAASLSGGYNGYTLNLDSGTLAIAQTGLTVSGFTVANRTYDGGTDASITANGSLTGVVTNDLVSLNSGGASATFGSRNAGTETATATGYALTSGNGNNDANNYTLTQPTATATITKATLTVTADAEAATYGDTLGTLTYSDSGLQTGDSITGALTVTGAGNAGTVLTNANGVNISGSPFTIAKGTIGVSDGNAGGNYNTLVYNGASLSLGKATLDVTANNQNRIFGAANPPLTYGISGFASGENLANSGVTGSPSLSTPATTSSPAGRYAIDAVQGSLAAGNYQFSMVDGTLTITPGVLLPPSVELQISYTGMALEMPGTYSEHPGTSPYLPGGAGLNSLSLPPEMLMPLSGDDYRTDWQTY
jgi:hypothetical protein